MKQAILFHTSEKGFLVCDACKMKCIIKEGGTGVCGVRKNVNNRLFLLVYGQASAVHIDPIEKKPLYHFLPGTDVFSLGTVGCNFGCSFCQNWSLSQVTRDLSKKLKKENRIQDLGLEVRNLGYDLSPQKIVDICMEENVPSIAYTYNEPAIFFEYLYDTSRLAHQKGIKNVFVSNGYESEETLELMEPYLHGINIDLKSFSDKFYTKICKARLKPVLDTIERIHQMGIWLELTTLIIPGKNDSDAELRDIAAFIANIDENIPWHISAFHPDYKMKNIQPTSLEVLLRACDIGKSKGLRHIYIGNAYSPENSATWCPNCQKKLIGRNGYRIQCTTDFKGGQCQNCQTKIAGVWN